MARFAGLAQSILVTEMDLHRSFAAEWGVPEAELEAERPSPATAAYCDFLLRTAALGDYAELVAALLPCMWGYAEIGQRLAALPDPGGGHDGYARWIAMYASDEFAELAAWSRGLTDAAAADVGGAGRERMHAAFAACSAHEVAFWEAAWRRS
jgi:thiaminase/transcriptional activator TenA